MILKNHLVVLKIIQWLSDHLAILVIVDVKISDGLEDHLMISMTIQWFDDCSMILRNRLVALKII